MIEEVRPPDVETLPDAPYLQALNHEQREAVRAPRSEAIQVLAGAGTGKTKLISHRFVKLVSELHAAGVEMPQERILAVTFTEDAARELSLRIHQQLLEMEYAGLSESAWISTFHRFCLRILQQHHAQVDLSPQFQVLDAMAQQRLFTRILDKLKRNEYTDLADMLPRYHLESLPKDVLSLSSLIALKLDSTAELLNRIPRVIHRIKSAGLSPLEFLNTARRQSQALSEQLKTLPVTEPYSGEPIAEGRGYSAAWHQHLKPWAADHWNPLSIEDTSNDLKDKDYLKPVEFLFKPLKLVYYDRSKKKYLPDTSDYTALDRNTGAELKLIPIIAAVYAVYLETMRVENTVDFDGLINGAISLLSREETLRRHYQNFFEAIIVDEFQDSNGSELRLLRLLTREDAPNITVVGDEKQSIYGFRFAQRENMGLVFGGRPYTAVHLHVNYRSDPAILGVANRLTQTLSGSLNRHVPLSSGKAAPPSHPVQWLTLGHTEIPEDTPGGKPGRPAKEPIATLKKREARLIAIEIARLVKDHGYQFRDIAILVKQHQKTETLQSALQTLGIPAVRKKDIGFFKQPIIKDAMALLNLSANPSDDVSLLRILQSRLNQRQIRVLFQLKTSLKASLFHVLHQIKSLDPAPPLAEPVLTALGSLADGLQTFHQRATQLKTAGGDPVTLFLDMVDFTGLIRPGDPETANINPRTQLRVFEKVLVEITETLPPRSSMTDVVSALETCRDNPDFALPVADALAENAVQMMTVHGSKGLEFPVVFVAYTEDGKLSKLEDSRLLFDPQFEGKAGFGLMYAGPSGEAAVKKEVYKKIWHQPRLEEEEKRLFYVALTRARERLYVLRAQQSLAWTAPEAYPSDTGSIDTEIIEAHHEQDEPEWFEASYWSTDMDRLRQALETHLRPKTGQQLTLDFTP